MLGLLAPRLPNGDVLVFAKDAKPELANADLVICGFSLAGVDLCDTPSSLSAFAAGLVAVTVCQGGLASESLNSLS